MQMRNPIKPLGASIGTAGAPIDHLNSDGVLDR
jgi:hypothetical protein